jgi:hypothetical protein
MQQPIDDYEKIIQPAFRQRAADPSASISFTESLIAQVGMGDSVVGGRWMGIQSHDPIGLKRIGQLLPL